MKDILKYQNLIKKHLLYFNGRGFKQLNERLYCDFCGYSIKIDRKHIKAQIQSHLRSQKHQNNERSKFKLNNKNFNLGCFLNEENNLIVKNLDLAKNKIDSLDNYITKVEKITCDVSLNLENINSFVLKEDVSNSLFTQSYSITNVQRNFSQNSKSTILDYQGYNRLKVTEPSSNVLSVQLNRVEKKNAIDDLMFNEIKDCFKKLNCDQYFRSAVLSSNSNVFCAGIDFQTLIDKRPSDKLDVSKRATKIRESIKHLQSCTYSLAQCQKPIIAAVNGECIGAGMNFLSFTDIRYCTKKTLFSIKEVDLGIAADIGVLQCLPRIIGNNSLLREVVFTGCFFNSNEAKEMGLVSKIFEDEKELLKNSLELAEKIATKSPVAVQGSKVFLEYSKDHSVLDCLDFAATWNMAMLQSNDLVKSVMLSLNKKDGK